MLVRVAAAVRTGVNLGCVAGIFGDVSKLKRLDRMAAAIVDACHPIELERSMKEAGRYPKQKVRRWCNAVGERDHEE